MTAADLAALSDEELRARREELAEALTPLWLRFDMMQDEQIRRDRVARDRSLAAARAESIPSTVTL